MTIEDHMPPTRKVDEALGELKGLIAERFPHATFVAERGDDPPGTYLVVTVDVEDTDEVYEVVAERLLELQVEEGLPVYVTPIRPVERVVAELRAREVSAPLAPLPA